ncbi:cell wall hydrolase [Acinetobacter soli]|uniref:cell wall hydrolase n=1 Tax=Acinetobacter soli TaxID=487316 RepID=UPI000CE4FFC3|nr:cell wall hydrolase [Acinetobacter soli]PPB85682.1 phage tail tape measure protein [Acinetobacter soli]
MAQAGVIRDFLVALGFQTDNAGLAKMQGAMAGVELKAKALNLALMSLATGAVIAVRQTASELDKLYFSSQRIGASATNITAFGNAISQMGGNAESALGTLEGLAEKMRNSPGYEVMLNGLGVSTKEANGDMRDRVEVMKDLSGVLSQMPAYQANAYAQSLGIDQNTLLAMRDGKFLQNMEKYQKIQKELGMNDDLTKSGNEFMTEYRDLTMMTKTGFQVIVMQAGKALIPVLRLLNQMIRAGIQAFSQLNPQIKEGLAIGLRFAFLSLVFGAFFKTFGIIFRLMPLLKGFIGLLKMMRLAFLASPIGIILALAAALAALYDDYKTWKEGGKSLIDWSKWNDNLEKIMSKLRDFIELLNSVKDKVINFVQKIVSDPVSAVKEVVDTAKDALTDINNGPTSEPVKAINELSKNIVDTAKGAIQKAKEVVVGGAKIINDEVKTTVAHSRIGKELKLSESDIIDIMKVASTEVVGSLKGKNFENQAAGVVDTILNRAASGKFGNSVRDVINQKNAFSDINAKRKSAYGSVQNVPMSRVSKRMEKFIRDYIEKRAKGQASIVDDNISYANPNFLGEASAATKKWVAEVEAQAKKSGQVFGAGNAIHVHGTPTADKHKKPKQFYISTPSTQLSDTKITNTGSSLNLSSVAPPSGNPYKSQINNASNMSASNVTIHQTYQTDMTINGARDPVESAKAVKRQQENFYIVMARGAQGVIA